MPYSPDFNRPSDKEDPFSSPHKKFSDLQAFREYNNTARRGTSAYLLYEKSELENILTLHPDSLSGDILVLGAGTGREIRILLDMEEQLGCTIENIYAVDISNNMLTVAKQEIRDLRLKFQHKDMNDPDFFTQFPHDSFMLITGLFGLLSFAQDPQHFLNNVHDKLQVGGIAVLCVYNQQSPAMPGGPVSAYMSKEKKSTLIVEHDGTTQELPTHAYTPEAIEQHVRNARLLPLSVVTYPYLDQLPPEGQIGKIDPNNQTGHYILICAQKE